MHCSGLLRNVHLGVEAAGFLLLVPVGEYLYYRNLDDAVLGDIQSCGLKVEEDDRAFEI